MTKEQFAEIFENLPDYKQQEIIDLMTSIAERHQLPPSAPS